MLYRVEAFRRFVFFDLLLTLDFSPPACSIELVGLRKFVHYISNQLSIQPIPLPYRIPEYASKKPRARETKSRTSTAARTTNVSLISSISSLQEPLLATSSSIFLSSSLHPSSSPPSHHNYPQTVRTPKPTRCKNVIDSNSVPSPSPTSTPEPQTHQV